MVCTRVSGPGYTAIVCGPRRRTPRCACGRPAPLLCDWKVQTKKGTCSRPICEGCTTSPAEGKDLCREHAEVWGARLAAYFEMVRG